MPAATATVEAIVSVVLPLAALLVGLNAAVAPEGSPLVPKVTVEEKPPVIVKVTVDVALLPADSLIVVGDDREGN